jgi:predicted phage terminase large subunit-like protein
MARRGMLLPDISSPADLAARVMRDFVCPPHIALLNSTLVDVAEGRITRLQVHMPPRCGKSLLCSQYFPAWFLGRFPDKRIILASYAAEFAASWGRKARNILEEHADELFGWHIERDSRASDRWDIAGHTGGMITAGRGSGVTGKGGHIILLDDCLKDAEEASSQTIREGLWDWYRSTLYTRQEPGCAIIAIDTRWHSDDLGGRLDAEEKLGGDKWERVVFPALAEGDDILGRVEGEALWPERFSSDKLQEIKQTLGSYFWSSLYQQRPQPEGGSVFKRSWFRYWRMADGYYILSRDGHDETVDPADCWRFQTIDAAATEKETADYFVCSTWAVTPKSDLLLLSVFRERAETTKHAEILKNQYRRWGPAWQGVESVTFGINIIQDARNSGLPIRALKADKDKVSRARNVAARYEIGKVFHALGSDWLDDYETEMLSFPTGKHDDMVDTASYAGVALSEMGRGDNWLDDKPKQEAEPEDSTSGQRWY